MNWRFPPLWIPAFAGMTKIKFELTHYLRGIHLLCFSFHILGGVIFMRTKTIRQSVTFNVVPHEVFEALMDSKKHAKFTGAPAKISRKIGGKFMAHGDYIE